METPKVIPGAQPRFYRGNEIGCVIAHGFMASPAEVDWMGQHLAAQGYTVYVPRLPGHGIDPQHMTRMRWEDWYAHVLDAYGILRQQCEQVYMIGHSMGGLLSMLLSLEEQIEGLVLVATPITLSARILPYTRWLSPLYPYSYHPSEPELNAVIEEEQLQRGEPVVCRVHYPQWSTRAVYEMYRLVQIARPQVERVMVPTLLLFSENDTTATTEQMDWLARTMKSPLIEQVGLKTGGHIIFQDEGREEAFTVVAGFIARCVARGR